MPPVERADSAGNIHNARSDRRSCEEWATSVAHGVVEVNNDEYGSIYTSVARGHDMVSIDHCSASSQANPSTDSTQQLTPSDALHPHTRSDPLQPGSTPSNKAGDGRDSAWKRAVSRPCRCLNFGIILRPLPSDASSRYPSPTQGATREKTS